MTDTRTPPRGDAVQRPDAGPQLEIDIEIVGTHRRVSVRGELDLATADQLATALSVLPCADKPVVLLDLAQLSFCDAHGLNTLLAAYHAHQAAGGALVVSRCSRPVARLLRLTGLDQVLINQR